MILSASSIASTAAGSGMRIIRIVRADADRHQRIAGAADVEQRHRDLHARSGAEALVRRDVARVREHAAVGEHRALREAGRARGVELHEAVARALRDGSRRSGSCAASQASYSSSAPPTRITRSTVRQRVAQLLDGAGELRPDEEQARLRVVDHVGDLGRREPEVDDGVGGADLRAGQRQLEAGRVVEVEHGDAVAGREARRPLGRGRIAAHAFGQLRPGPVQPGEASWRRRRAAVASQRARIAVKSAGMDMQTPGVHGVRTACHGRSSHLRAVRMASGSCFRSENCSLPLSGIGGVNIIISPAAAPIPLIAVQCKPVGDWRRFN